MDKLFDLRGKTVVAIGGNSTLGSSIAIGLAEYGASIAVVGRNMDKADKTAQAIIGKGGNAKVFQADATSREDLERVANEVLQWTGKIDVLLNAPGKNSSTPFFEIKDEEWDEIMDINLKGMFMSCQIFGKKMIDLGNGGSIINISSVSSTTPLSRVFTYSVSKAGVNSLTQYLARDFAEYGIRVNAIIPGFFPAEQNRKILDGTRIESIMNHTPMKRFGEPNELQGAAVWLASEKASSFVTGVLIRVDGGYGAMTI
jgi:NAD(P)-dependent dehydrogenase (short-subunit alcohol dehydrogenase family)